MNVRGLVIAGLSVLSGTAWAGATVALPPFVNVPTLDEAGLAVLVALVAGVAGWAVRRRARK